MSSPATAPTTNPDDPLLSPPETAAYLKLTVLSLQQMRYMGTGPRYSKLTARAIRYRRSDLDEWVTSKTRSSSREVG